MRKKNSLIIFLLVMLLGINPALAAPELIGTVDQTEITMNDAVTLIVSASEIDFQNIEFPAETPDYVVVATSTSSNFRYIQGQVSSSKTYKFVIKPKHTGNILLPPASVNAGGNIYSTNTITVLVHPPSASPAAPAMVKAPVPVNSAETAPASAQSGIFIKQYVSKLNPYVNEQINLTLKVYHRGNLRSIEIPPLQFTTFVAEKDGKAKEYQEVLNGEEYLVYEVDYALFPAKPGSVVIPALDLRAIVMEERPMPVLGGFDPFRFMMMNPFIQEREIRLKSNSIELNTKALPSGAPKGFSGYVGTLTVNHSLDNDSVKSGEPLNLLTKISGRGNYRIINLDLIEKSQLYTIFKDKEKIHEHIVSGSKIFDLSLNSAIIPNNDSGKLLVKVAPIIVFNPNSAKYEALGAKDFTIKVLPNPDAGKKNNTLNYFKKRQAKVEKKLEILTIPEEEIQNYRANPVDIKVLWILILVINLLAIIAKIYKAILRINPLERFKTGAQPQLYLKNIRKAETIPEISKQLRELRTKIPVETLGPVLDRKLDEFFAESDRVNYSMPKDNQDLSQQIEYFRTNAISLVKEIINAK